MALNLEKINKCFIWSQSLKGFLLPFLFLNGENIQSVLVLSQERSSIANAIVIYVDADTVIYPYTGSEF